MHKKFAALVNTCVNSIITCRGVRWNAVLSPSLFSIIFGSSHPRQLNGPEKLVGIVAFGSTMAYQDLLQLVPRPVHSLVLVLPTQEDYEISSERKRARNRSIKNVEKGTVYCNLNG